MGQGVVGPLELPSHSICSTCAAGLLLGMERGVVFAQLAGSNLALPDKRTSTELLGSYYLLARLRR